MISPSLACDSSIGSKLADFSPASVANIAVAFSFFAMQPAWNNYFPTGQTNPFAFAMNAIGDLFSSVKPKEILTQVSPTATIKGPPTPTLQYQPESTSSILYAVALCAVLVLVGAVFTIMRNNTTNLSSPSSSVNSPFYIGSEREMCDNGSSLDGDLPEDFGIASNEGPVAPSDDPVDQSNNGTESDSKVPGKNPSVLIGDIGGSPPPPPPPSSTTSGMDDDSNKNARGFLAKLKMFLIIFAFLTTLTHGGRITKQVRSFAIHDDFTFSNNNTSVTPYLRQVLELVTTKASHFDNIPVTLTRGNTLAPEIVEKLQPAILASSIHSAIPQARYKEIPSSGLSEIISPSILWSPFSSGSNEKYDSTSFPAPTKNVMSSTPTSVYPIGLSFVAVKLGTPTTSSPSKVALTLGYVKLFTLFFIFCTFIPILSFAMTILPSVIQFLQLWDSRSADQRECLTHDEAMKFNVNEVDLAIKVVENSKVDINIIHDKVVPVSTFMNKGKGKALEAIEEKDETVTCPLASKESLDLATPALSTHTLADRQTRAHTRRPRPPRQVRNANKRMRKADKAAIEAALQAGSFP